MKIKKIITPSCKIHPEYAGARPPTSKNKLCTCKNVFDAAEKKRNAEHEQEQVLVARERGRTEAFVVHGTTTRLQEGMVIYHAGQEFLVEMVNECRARCRPLNTTRKQVTFTNARGKTFSFNPEMVGATINISPNSECEILRRVKV